MSGRLAILLHTHMPYVEGFGTWPFGDEWLWEAIATSYLPLLDLLDDAPGRITVSMTPVLADQLEAPGVLERCLAFLSEIRPASHALDLQEGYEAPVRAELERSAARYAAAAGALERRGDLLAAFAPHVSWTSAATHAVLPLLATDAGVRLQVETGIAAHRARFGAWAGGFWLPECAHAPWLDGLLEEAGVHATCVDWSGVLGPGLHAPRRSQAGVTLVPLDREAIDLAWHPRGYPSHGAYRDSHRLTPRAHRPWANDGAPYDPARGAAQAAADARDFVARVRDRTRDGGLSVCAFDTELLGHFWHEGVTWLRAVLEAAEEAGLPVVPLDAAALGESPPGDPATTRVHPAPAPSRAQVELAGGSPPGDPATMRVHAAPAPCRAQVELAGESPPGDSSSWGEGRDLRTWSSPPGGDVAWLQRGAELAALGAGPSPRALRELLALQSSDWAFLIAAQTAGDYPRERVAAHHAAFRAALAGAEEPALRALAPALAAWAFVVP